MSGTIDLRYILVPAWEVAVAGVADRVEVDPRVMLGRPVVRGTRITDELILRKLSEGATKANLLDAYSWLTREDIRAAIGHAAEVLSRRRDLRAASSVDDAMP
jgi:uncharacterized protein (DUF433 family)